MAKESIEIMIAKGIELDDYSQLGCVKSKSQIKVPKIKTQTISKSDIKEKCPGGDSNSHDCSPPPQDGASANFATSAWFSRYKNGKRIEKVNFHVSQPHKSSQFVHPGWPRRSEN